MAPPEKGSSLLLPHTAAQRPRWTWVGALLLYTTAFAATFKTSYDVYRRLGGERPLGGENPSVASWAKCPQVEPLLPDYQTPALMDMEEFLRSDKFREDAVERMAGAIRIRTE
ncbi:hypothetical protein O1611_g8390 [Lasiodiplodia mahajangana]|uniref:Uncharacterized protein n=1 Tax=Lasiodiplodia mahajangana TaxID=1108764 RepID=A0ACC2JCQ0_9PEZI|nr:hypothetical protein O1611_g8390 [Lasiodiplodia mahajangana]